MLIKYLKRVFSFVIAFSVIFGIGLFDLFQIKADNVILQDSLYLASCKILSTSTNVMIQMYVGAEKDESVTVDFYSAKSIDVYGFESTCGGEVMDERSSIRETSMQATDENGMFVTWTTDASETPYQAFEADVTDVTGPIVLAYEGTEGYHEGYQDKYEGFDGYKGIPVDTNNCMIMQVYNPKENRYFEVARRKYINGIISLSCTLDSQAYAENGRVRYRVTFPEEAEYKWMYTKSVTAGQPDKSVLYGTKTRKSSGNTSIKTTQSFDENSLLCAVVSSDRGFAYSPIYSFVSKESKQDQLYHFNVNFNGDSKTSRGMTWATTTDMDCYVQVVPYGPLYPDYKNAVTYKGYTERYTDSNTTKQYSHYVLVDGLEKGHEYWYRYGNGNDIWSTDCYLRIDDGDSDFSFVIMGDPQPEASSYNHNDDERDVFYGARYKEMMLSWNEAVRLTGAELLVSCGDETDAAYWETCWDYYFKSNMPYFRSQTLAVTMGNHDFRYQDSKYNYKWWVRKHNLKDPTGLYALKTNVVPGEDYQHGSFYSFDYGNAHFSVINGNVCSSNQFKDYFDAELEWLENDLASTNADFKIVVSHQGMYSFPVHTYDAETKEIRAAITPLLDKYDVDLMFQGHDHVWIRTSSIKGGAKVSNNDTFVDVVDGKRTMYYVDPIGTTFVNSGSATGSKYHEPDPTKFLSLFSVDCSSQPNLPTFTTVEISGGKLQVKGWARTGTGECKRISSFQCYPTGYAQSEGYNILNTSYYNKITDRIDALPDVITLDNKDEVEALKEMCDKESNAVIDKYITNYAKLNAAVESIEEIELEASVPELKVEGTLAGEALTGESVILPKVTAFDKKDGEVDVVMLITPNEGYEIKDYEVVFNKAGAYTLTYTATDTDGHSTSKEFLINVTLSAMLGDFDKDEQITVADALAALRIAAKLVDETPEALTIGDIDGDEHITVADALAILRVAAKLVGSL